MKNSKLIEARKQIGLTQVEVAKKARTTARSYQYYEAGKRTPSVKTAIKIAKTVNNTVEELFE